MGHQGIDAHYRSLPAVVKVIFLDQESMRFPRQNCRFKDPLIKEIINHRIDLFPFVIGSCLLGVVAGRLLALLELNVVDYLVREPKVIIFTADCFMPSQEHIFCNFTLGS
jgi:hypothetical protein